MALSSAVESERGQLYQLIQSAEASYYLRDAQSQLQIGLALQSFAYPFNQVGKYYESMFLFRTGQHQKARQLLESVAELAPSQYRSRALLSLSGLEENIGRFEESLRLRLQVLSSDDPLNMMEAQWGIAALRSSEGDHKAALRDLEQFLPVAQIIGKRGHPAYIKFLNSYALELSESGRATEAEQTLNVIAASPLISQYPEWQDTIAEVLAKSKTRPIVSVSLPTDILKRQPRIQAAIDFMAVNIHRRIVLAELANACNLSSSHFIHLFKAETGFSPIAYLLRMRMDRASQLLATTFLSVKQVIAEVGFNSKSDFYRHFRKRFGVTPTEYRKQKFGG